jgi:hypothetical protein
LILQGVNLIKFITVTNEEFLIRYITTIFSDMKIITSKLTLLIVLSTIIVVVVGGGGNLTISQTSMADNIDKSFTSSSLHPISVQNLDTTADSDQYHDSFVWSHSSASKMTDVLTASFTNILDTQIYTGLDKVAN